MARRVNTQFLVVLTVLVVGLGTAALVAPKFLIREKPDKYIEAGNKAMKDKKYDEALSNYGRAARADERNPQRWVDYGDAFYQLSATDLESLGKARQAWEKALELDPANKGALSRMLRFYDEFLDLDPRPKAFEQVRDISQKLITADPSDLHAATELYGTQIRAWLFGVETDPARIDQSIEKLTELMTKDPTAADPPYWIARAKINHAAEQQRTSQDQKRVGELVNDGIKTLDEALKRHESAALHFRTAQVLITIDQEGLTYDKGKERREKELARARELAKTDDELYTNIFLVSADNAIRGDKRDVGEKIYRELLKNKPNEQMARLALAELLASTSVTKRDEALALLEEKVITEGQPGPRAIQNRRFEVLTMAAVTNLRMDQYQAASPEERKSLRRKIDESIGRIRTKAGEAPLTLMLVGKLQRLDGDNVGAIQTLQKALNLSNQSGAQQDYQLMDLLARAYIDSKQTGQAKALLFQIVKQQPGYVPARVLFTQLLLQERAYDSALPHIDLLERAPSLKNEPEIIRLRLMYLMSDPVKNKADIATYYGKLPEKSARERLDKSNFAQAIGNMDDATRVLSASMAADPGDMPAVQSLVQIYINKGMRNEAIQVVANARKAKPNDPDLPAIEDAIQKGDLSSATGIRRDYINQIKDPFTREMGLAQVCREEGKNEEQLQHLLAAQKISPKDLGMMQQLFTYYYVTKNFDEAAKLVDPLAAANGDKAGGLVFRFRLALARGELAAANDYARAMVDKLPEFAQSWLCLGQVLQATGQYEDALGRFSAARDRQSENIEAFRGIIECYYQLQRPAEAKNAINVGLQTLPNNAYLKEARILHEINYGDPQRAIPEREAARNAVLEKPGNWISLGRAYLVAAKKLKDDAAVKKLLEKAHDTFNEGMTKWPDEPRFYASFAESCLLAHIQAEGEAALKRLIARDTIKDKTDPTMMLADFYVRSGRPNDAEIVLKDLLAKTPANIDIQLAYSQLLMSLAAQAETPEKASAKNDAALAALDANFDDPRIARKKIELQIQLNRMDDADRSLRQALAKRPNAVELLALAGYVDMNRGRYADADVRLRRALEIDKKNAGALYFMGMLRLRQPIPDLDDAIRYLTSLREQAPTNTEARLQLSSAFRQKNDVDSAIRELEAALQAAPEDKRVRLALIDAYRSVVPSPRWFDVETKLNEAFRMPQFENDPDLFRAAALMWEQRADLNKGEQVTDLNKAAEFIRKANLVAPNNMAFIRQYLDLMLKAKNYGGVMNRTAELLAGPNKPWWAYEARAIAERALDRKDDALSDFGQALNGAMPENQGAHVILKMTRELGADAVLDRVLPRAANDNRWRLVAAYMYQAKNDWANAATTFDAIYADYEKLPPAQKAALLRFGGQLYLAMPQPQPDKARNLYGKLLEMSPNDISSLNNMAFVLAEYLNKPPEGLKYSQRAYDITMSMNAKQAAVMDTHGWLLTLNGRVDEGIDLLRQVVDTQPFIDAHYHLAKAYLQKAIPEEAERQLALAEKLIHTAEEKQEPVDARLRANINAAEAQANEMVRSKSQAKAP